MIDWAELMTPSQASGSSMSQDFSTLEDSAAVELNQTDLKQQPFWFLAAVISFLQLEVQLTLEVLHADSRWVIARSCED